MAFLNVSLSAEQLEEGVKKVIASLVQDYKAFTAWTVTEILRKEAGPQLAIPHAQVRDLVHDLMLPFVAENYYDLDNNWQVPNQTITAKYYSPTELWTVNNIVPQLQLNSAPTPLLKVVIPNIRVNSTLVRGVSYNGTTELGELTVKLDTASYKYVDVPFSTYLKFVNADSKGIFFNTEVRGKFHSIKVTDDDDE